MIRFAAVLSVVAAPLWAAPVCEMRGAEPVEVLEQAKEAFLHSEFDDFVAIAAEIMPEAAAQNILKELRRLDGLLPDGFDSCQTVVQRRDTGGMVQEVTTFNVKGQDFPISLYLQVTPVRDRMLISYLNFNTTMSDVLDQLR